MEIKELKTGAVRIAAAAGVPLIPVVLWGTQRMMTKDHPRDFSRGTAISIRVGEPLHLTGEDPSPRPPRCKAALQALLDDAIARLPRREQPPGAWWLPASYGGSAPTLEEAEALDAAEKRQRAEAPAARRQEASARSTRTPTTECDAHSSGRRLGVRRSTCRFSDDPTSTVDCRFVDIATCRAIDGRSDRAGRCGCAGP